MEESLGFFREDDFSYRISTLSDGILASRWLCNTARAEDVSAGFMSYDGYFGLDWIISQSYIRPAFTLPPETKIKQIEYNGEEIYVLDLA